MKEKNGKGITRRNALKRMGLFMAGAAAWNISATSCSMEKKRRIIFYFTATGNSLHIARQLADESTELLSIPQMMKRDNLVFEADEIGLVFPDYRAMAPEMVKRFLEKATLKAPYLFSIITYGNWACNVIESWNKFALGHNVRFNYIASILMVDNFLPVFDMNEQMKMDKKEDEQLQKIMADVQNRQNYIPELPPEERQRCEEVLKHLPGLFPVNSESLFEINGNCVDCAICTEVCPRGNYRLTSTGVKTEGDCEYCLACVHNCPQKAIQLKRGERNPNARYRNEHVSLWSIKDSNRQ